MVSSAGSPADALVSEPSLNGLLRRLVQDLVEHGVPLHQAKQEFERQYLVASLQACNGSLTRAADLLGVHRNTLRNKMDALDLDAQPYQRPVRRG